MGLFKRKPKVTIEEFCGQFYDSSVFHAIIGEADVWKLFCETAFESLVKVDESFASVNRVKFEDELIAVRMEMFALAWMHRFKREELTLPQSLFTRRYLEENGHLDIWEIMGEYNHAVANSTLYTETGQEVNAVQVEKLNELRFGIYYRWTDNLDESIAPEQKLQDGKCVARVGNRMGVEIPRDRGFFYTVLRARLADRLDCDASIDHEVLWQLGAMIYGFYQGSKDAINEIDLLFESR